MKLALVLAAVLLAGCPNQSKNDSMNALNAGNKAAGAKQFDNALAEYQKSVELMKENHLAWYGMGGAQAARGQWDKASDAFANAVQLEPDQAMYQMWYGIALYEKAVATAREEQAHKENKKPEEIQVDLSVVNFQTPLQHLQKAVELNKDMWRAHYYLGRVYRGSDKPKEAADEFSKALAANPRESAPYVALGELYRKWDYSAEAIKVASQGAQNVPGSNEVTDIWYVLGMGYDDQRKDKEAVDAFTKAIETSKGNQKAKFQRGQTYFRMADYSNAKKDLEEFAKAGGASLEFNKQQANKMLMDIAAKSAPPVAPGDPKGGAAPADPKKAAVDQMLKNGGGPPKKKK